MIQTPPPPADSLLRAHAAHADYTDCFAVAGDADLPRFMAAFYATPLFKLERLILRLVGYPSTDTDVAALANGAQTFAVWTVTARTDDQIMLTDRTGATASWLCARDGMLYFGSAVFGSSRLVRATTGLHRVYARALLAAARRRVQASAT